LDLRGRQPCMNLRHSLPSILLTSHPPSTVRSMLLGATRCYVHGLFQGTAVLTRSTMEAALEDPLRAHRATACSWPIWPLAAALPTPFVASSGEPERPDLSHTRCSNALTMSARLAAVRHMDRSYLLKPLAPCCSRLAILFSGSKPGKTTILSLSGIGRPDSTCVEWRPSAAQPLPS
jgi:hypothetical protein